MKMNLQIFLWQFVIIISHRNSKNGQEELSADVELDIKRASSIEEKQNPFQKMA